MLGRSSKALDRSWTGSNETSLLQPLTEILEKQSDVKSYPGVLANRLHFMPLLTASVAYWKRLRSGRRKYWKNALPLSP